MRCKCTNSTVDKDTEEMDTENNIKDTEEAAKDMKAKEAATKEAALEMATKEELLGATEMDMVKIEDTINPKMRQALVKCTSNIIAEIVR